jgi:membrane protein
MRRRLYDLLGNTAAAWSEDNMATWAAALAFYTMLSIGPLLFVAISIVGLAFGHDAAEGAILGQIGNVMGHEAERGLAVMIREASQPARGAWATALGLATLLFGASGVFSALQEAMNVIWHVRAKPDASFKMFLKRRFLSMSMVVGLGFLLMVSLVLNGIVAAVWSRIEVDNTWLLTFIEFAASWALIAFLLAAIFKLLPDAQLKWRDVWLGAGATALMLGLGEALIGIYLGRSGVTTPFGAAGSLAVVLLWVYYAAQILFFGAEFTRVYFQRVGDAIKPAADAIVVEVVDVTQQLNNQAP